MRSNVRQSCDLSVRVTPFAVAPRWLIERSEKCGAVFHTWLTYDSCGRSLRTPGGDTTFLLPAHTRTELAVSQNNSSISLSAQSGGQRFCRTRAQQSP